MLSYFLNQSVARKLLFVSNASDSEDSDKKNLITKSNLSGFLLNC